MKSDNILTWTLSLDADVNVKLSDYNFSQYTTPKGLKKMLGTPGYQAPEILQRYSFDNCVRKMFCFVLLFNAGIGQYWPRCV